MRSATAMIRFPPGLPYDSLSRETAGVRGKNCLLNVTRPHLNRFSPRPNEGLAHEPLLPYGMMSCTRSRVLVTEHTEMWSCTGLVTVLLMGHTEMLSCTGSNVLVMLHTEMLSCTGLMFWLCYILKCGPVLV